MNIKILIVIITIISVITLGCATSDKSIYSNSDTTIKLMKTETINDVNFKIFHDNEYNVTCWHMDSRYAYGEAGNCISDSELNSGN